VGESLTSISQCFILQQNLEAHGTRLQHASSHCFPSPTPLLPELGSGLALADSSACSITPFQFSERASDGQSKTKRAAILFLIPLSAQTHHKRQRL
jgi:hypothetical protein